MQMRDYLTKYDSLASEDTFYEIPVRKEYILSKVGRGKKVLDVGCLGGRLSKLIQDQNNDVYAIEVNPHAANVAKKRGIKVTLADVEEGLPYEDGFFDVVNAGELVEQLYDTKFFFQEVNRVLKPKGLFLFSTPNLNSLENRIRIVIGGYPAMVGAYPEDHFGESVRVFNLDKVRELCQETQFKVIDVSGVPNLNSLGKWIDSPLAWMGKVAPSLSKLLMVAAQKND